MNHTASSPSFALRVATAETCNMACVYCPQPSMENLTPPKYRNQPLSHDRFCTVMRNLLQAIELEKVSFTGGEPLVNRRLHEIAAAAHDLVPRLELNTNGVLLTEDRWSQLRPFLKQIKISIDTLDAREFDAITAFAGPRGLDRVLAAVDIVRHDDVELVLNGVIMRRNLDGIFKLIEYVARRGLILHLLDFNFTPECASEWEREFMPSEELIALLADRFGAAYEVPRYGCGYFEFYPANDSVVRVRTSYSGTMRSPRCVPCAHYCQTGLFGLRLSTHGWVTYCFSAEEIDGVLLTPDMSVKETHETVMALVHDIVTAALEPDSLNIMIARHGLKPVAPLNVPQIRRTVLK